MAGPTIECSTACTVTVQIEPAPADAEKLADLGLAFGLMLMVCLLIWGARQMLRVFTGSPYES